MQGSARLAVLLRSPKVAFHRLHWTTEAKILTKWQLASFKSELSSSPGNSIFGKARSMVADPPDSVIEEGEECKVH